jgi:uncharacterized membrane protein YGL010W
MTTQKLVEYYRFFEKHHHGYNFIIHTVAVPTVMFCFFSLLGYIQFFQLLIFDIKFEVGLDFVLLIIYFATYLLFDFTSGVLMTPILLTLYFGAYFLRTVSPYVWCYALGLNIFGWGCLFLGHTFFEKKLPGLIDHNISKSFSIIDILDGFFQAFILTPQLIFLKISFLLGFRKNLKEKIDIVEESND